MMRFMHLKSHWTPEDAHTAISLLDEQTNKKGESPFFERKSNVKSYPQNVR